MGGIFRASQCLAVAYSKDNVQLTYNPPEAAIFINHYYWQCFVGIVPGTLVLSGDIT